MADLSETLSARASRYGRWHDNAHVSQTIHRALTASPHWSDLPDFAREGLTMIGQKIARVLNGDPRYEDNWHDIAGYALLCEEECRPVTLDAPNEWQQLAPQASTKAAPRRGFWYLATQYTKHPDGHHAAYLESRDAAILLIQEIGLNIFAPIVHTHPLAQGGLTPPPGVEAHDFWLKMDEAFMRQATGLIVVCSPGWLRSIGVSREIQFFGSEGKPRFFLKWPSPSGDHIRRLKDAILAAEREVPYVR